MYTIRFASHFDYVYIHGKGEKWGSGKNTTNRKDERFKRSHRLQHVPFFKGSHCPSLSSFRNDNGNGVFETRATLWCQPAQAEHQLVLPIPHLGSPSPHESSSSSSSKAMEAPITPVTKAHLPTHASMEATKQLKQTDGARPKQVSCAVVPHTVQPPTTPTNEQFMQKEG